MPSGKSKSNENAFGKRRIIRGAELAPKSLKRKGKKFLADCTDEEKIKAGIKEKPNE